MSSDEIGPQPEPVWAEAPAPAPAPGPAGRQAPPWPGWGYQPPPPPKPGVVPLAPLGIAEILRGVFDTLRHNLAALYLPLLGVVLGALVLLGGYGVVGYLSLQGLIDDLRAQPDYQPTDAQRLTIVALLAGGLLLLALCSLALSTVAATTSTGVLRHATLGRRVTARQIRTESARYLWRVLGGQLLVGAGGLGILVVSLLPAVLLAGFDAGPALILVSLLLVVPAALVGTYVQVRLALVVPVIVLEDSRPVAAIRRAWRLNHGAWWRSLGIPYLVNMIASFAGQLVATPFVVIGAVGMFSTASTTTDVDGAVSTGAPSGGGIVFFVACILVGSALTSTLTLPLAPLTHGLLYLDRRIRRENLAPALATAAGLPGWAPAGPPAGPSADTPAPGAGPTEG
ncbi:hypothetical protein GCM10009760_20190 [Kitasatospora kazusensis]|uniref:Glycerophosphoryl diester phosphodiesterase membrane domain-containing protein n=1 Tax=Kitasatospora kazusensis TaxID=407974 RepID=A0ABP5L253_9ACTN